MKPSSKFPSLSLSTKKQKIIKTISSACTESTVPIYYYKPSKNIHLVTKFLKESAVRPSQKKPVERIIRTKIVQQRNIYLECSVFCAVRGHFLHKWRHIQDFSHEYPANHTLCYIYAIRSNQMLGKSKTRSLIQCKNCPYNIKSITLYPLHSKTWLSFTSYLHSGNFVYLGTCRRLCNADQLHWIQQGDA